MGRQSYLVASVLLAAILLIRFFLYFSNPPTIQNGQKLDFEARLMEEPQIKNGRQQFKVKENSGYKITVTTGLINQLEYGDKLHISGSVKSNIYKGHRFFTMDHPSLQIVNNDHNFISRSATGIRRFANELYRKSLPPIPAGLLSGIVFGGNQGLPKKFMEDLQVSGVIHVIAASGMNVTFVASALIGVLGAFFRRQIAITIAIFGVMFYAYISGFEPSIIRASIMAILAFSASLLGRQNFALGSIFFTAFCMLFYLPNLITDVGFQLSFLATLGILLVKPILDAGIKNWGIISKVIGDDLGTTIAAQVATLPVLLAVFGSYGILSILINALVLWTVPLLMVIGSIGLLLGMIFEPLGQGFLLLAVPILYYFEKVVTYFGNLGLSISIPATSNTIWIGYYLLLCSMVSLIRTSRRPIVDKLN